MQLDYIKCCDCVDGMRELPDCCMDLTVTSPPYGNLRKYNGFSFDVESVVRELFRVTKQGGVVVWIVCDHCVNGGESMEPFKQALAFHEAGFRLYDTMIWEKPSPAAPTEGRYYDVFEYMFVFSKGKPKTLNLLADRENKSAGHVSKRETRSCREDRRYKEGTRTVKKTSRRFNVWHVSRGVNKTKHPAVFPEELARDHILSWSNPGDVILDPFTGSGTTAKMAQSTGRRYIGFEISEEYCEIARDRLSQMTIDIGE
jgi:site-specific DNA-methyltransferase (adenine-specific)|nr:MAG TPA: adenine-specific methyltransferase [Caudoviricetes sp.]